MEHTRLLEFARRARSDFESARVDRKLLSRLYLEYHPLADVDLFMSQAEKLFPNLCCGLASVYLRSVFPGTEVIRGMFRRGDDKENHTFLQAPSGWIVDITADQYGGPPVYVGPFVEPWIKLG